MALEVTGQALTREHGGGGAYILPATLEVEQAGAHQAAQQIRKVAHLWEAGGRDAPPPRPRPHQAAPTPPPHQVLARGVEELPEVEAPALLQVLLEGLGQVLTLQVGAAHAQGKLAGLWGERSVPKSPSPWVPPGLPIPPLATHTGHRGLGILQVQ